MPAIVVQQKAPVVVRAGISQPIVVSRPQPVSVVAASPARIGVEAHEKRVVVVQAGIPGPTGPKGEDAGPSNLSLEFGPGVLPGPIAIGTAPAHRRVLNVIVETMEEFDPGLTMAVGTDAAQGSLLTESENSLQAVGMYEKTVNYEYEGTPVFKAFFHGGGPCVTGRAKITISFT